jgi:Bifunctional DNA primase/polymerase, N-terminal
MPTAPAENPLLSAALIYAARGWHVFPLRPNDKRPAFPNHAADRCDGTDPRCTTGHAGWEQRATTDPDRIRRAWTSRPYGIGIACGPSGLVVIDLDKPKNGGAGNGAATWATLCEQAGKREPADTFTVHTGHRGTHLYFAHPPHGPQLRNTAGTLGPLIDTRAHGGYVVAAPSTANSPPYKVMRDAPAAQLPRWLADLLTPASLPDQTPVTVAVPTDRHSAYVYAALTAEVARVVDSPAHQHNTALYRAAIALGQLVAGGAIDATTVTALLAGAAATVGQPDGEAARTIASGLRSGANRPRQVAA